MTDTLVFRAAFGPLFLALCAAPLPLLVLAAYIGFGPRITAVVQQAVAVGLGPKVALLGLLFAALLLAAVAFAALTLSQRLIVHLRQTGLASRTAWGTLTFATWETITSARLVRLPFVTLLQVRRSTGRSLLVPLCLVDREDFDQALSQLAPAGHPVLVATKKIGGDSS